MKKAKPISKKWILIAAVIAVAVYSLMGFLIYPMKAYFSSDAVYAETVIPSLLDYFSDILEVGVVSLFYAIMIAFLYRYNGGMLVTFGSFTLVTAYKYLINIVMTWVNSGEIPTEWFWELVDIPYRTLLELLQLVVIYLFVKKFIGEFALLRQTKLKFAKDDNERASFEEPYPYKNLFSMRNCLLKSAFVCAIVTFAAKVSIELITDLMYILSRGLPQIPQTWLLMALNYLSVTVLGILVYFFTVAVMTIILRKKT